MLIWGDFMGEDKLVIRRKGEDGYRTFSVRIKEETVARIEAVAAKTDRSRNELIGTFLEYALDRCVVEDSRSE